MAKASSKVFFINRLRGKRSKNHKITRIPSLQDSSSDTPLAPPMEAQGSAKGEGGLRSHRTIGGPSPRTLVGKSKRKRRFPNI